MKKHDLISKIEAAINAAEEQGNFWCYGIRFENKGRAAGEIITDKSRHGGDEIDNRDFPIYGTEEYDAMPVFEGVSAYSTASDWKGILFGGFGGEFFSETTHCYLVGSDDTANHDDGLDHGEVVFVDAQVLSVIF